MIGERLPAVGTFSNEAAGQQTQERASVAASKHVRFSDECVNDLSAARKALKVNLRPGDPAEQLVLLKEDLDDPLMRQWIVEYSQRHRA
jgi:hypothetical protein